MDAAGAQHHLEMPTLAERQAINAQDPWSTVMHYDLNARGLFPLLMGFRRAEISMDLFFVQRGTFARLEYQMGVHSTYEAEA